MEDCKQEFISCCNPTDKQVMFKVGDWVRHIESNNIYKINGFLYTDRQKVLFKYMMNII